MKREEGHYTIKIVDKLPKRGNSNWLYSLKEDNLSVYYFWKLNNGYEKVNLADSISSTPTSIQSGGSAVITGTGTASDPYVIDFNETPQDLNSVLAEGSVTDQNVVFQSANEQELVFQRLGTYNDQVNPLFAFSRIVPAPASVGDVKFRVIARDDNKYTTEKPVLEFEGTGTLATLREEGVVGSFYEGFHGSQVEPMFRLSSIDLGAGNISSRLELGSGGNNPTDAFIERLGLSFAFVLDGGLKQQIYPDSVFKPGGIVDAFQQTTALPALPTADVLKVYNNNGTMGQLDSTGTFTSFTTIPFFAQAKVVSGIASDFSNLAAILDAEVPTTDDPFYLADVDGDTYLIYDQDNDLYTIDPSARNKVIFINQQGVRVEEALAPEEDSISTFRYKVFPVDFGNVIIGPDFVIGNSYKFNYIQLRSSIADSLTTDDKNTVQAPNASPILLNAASARTLVTKEYVDPVITDIAASTTIVGDAGFTLNNLLQSRERNDRGRIFVDVGARVTTSATTNTITITVPTASTIVASGTAVLEGVSYPCTLPGGGNILITGIGGAVVTNSLLIVSISYEQ